MAGSSLLMLIDDIVTLLDDVAVMTKVAAKKTAGVLGDDLALNAQQVAGIRAERELPVVWAVAKGSFLNKAILVPGALLISALAPWLITPLLMLGGVYLCFEGFEKIAQTFFHSKEEVEHQQELIAAINDPEIDLVTFEQEKIKGAIRTDFVLSAEIIVIALGSAAGAPFTTQALVVVMIAILMTIGVYGLVALIVKLDDMGLYLVQKPQRFNLILGRTLIATAPKLMQLLAILGTAAMFTVGGGIIAHAMPWVHHFVTATSQLLLSVDWLIVAALNALFGVLVGGLALALFGLASKVRQMFR